MSGLEQCIREHVAAVLGISQDEVAFDIDLERMGLNSSHVLSLAGELEERLGLDLDPTLFFEYRTVSELAAYLADLVADGTS